MKRFVLLLLASIVACQASPITEPTPPPATATLSRGSDCVLTGHVGEITGDDWLEGRTVWWSLDGRFSTSVCAAPIRIKVYAIGLAGERARLGSARLVHGPITSETCCLQWPFHVEGIAPRFPVGDYEFRFPKFEVEVYSRGALLGTLIVYSDVQLSPNIRRGHHGQH